MQQQQQQHATQAEHTTPELEALKHTAYDAVQEAYRLDATAELTDNLWLAKVHLGRARRAEWYGLTPDQAQDALDRGYALVLQAAIAVHAPTLPFKLRPLASRVDALADACEAAGALVNDDAAALLEFEEPDE